MEINGGRSVPSGKKIAKKDRPQWQKIAKKDRPLWQFLLFFDIIKTQK